MSMSAVGSVTWGTGGHTTAELSADGSWTVLQGGEPEPRLARNLARLYAGRDRHPSLHYGQGILPDLARLMGGTFTFNQPPPAATDEVN